MLHTAFPDARATIDRCRFAARKLAEHWGVFDRLGMLEQVGAIAHP